MTMSITTQKQPETPKTWQAAHGCKPNEQGSIVVQAYMRIFDPQTKQVYVEGRA